MQIDQFLAQLFQTRDALSHIVNLVLNQSHYIQTGSLPSLAEGQDLVNVVQGKVQGTSLTDELQARYSGAELERSMTAMCGVAQSVAKYVRMCAMPAYADLDVAEITKRSGLRDHDPEALAMFNDWMTRTMFGLYFAGIREALHAGETPLGVAQLEKTVDIACETLKYRPWWKRILGIA